MPDASSFRACLGSENYMKAVFVDADEAAVLQTKGTPTFVVARIGKDTLDGVEWMAHNPSWHFKRESMSC